MEAYDVIVVGAGPAGLLAAGSASKEGSRVLILEKMRQEGRKLLITGKGRCNITNAAKRKEFLKRFNGNYKFVQQIFNSFFSKDLVNFFKDLDVNREKMNLCMRKELILIGRFNPNLYMVANTPLT